MHEHTPLLMYVVTSPENRRETIVCAEAEIKRLQDELVSDDELQRVKTFINGTYVMAMETNRGQVSRYGAYEMAGLGWDYTNQFPELIRAVTPKDIQTVAQNYFHYRLASITAPLAEE
jgi:predicted Zn-dependent peptidase